MVTGALMELHGGNMLHSSDFCYYGLCFLAAAISGEDTLAMDNSWLVVSHPLPADKHASLSSPPFPHLSSTWPPYSTGVGHERGRLRHAAGA